MQNQRVIRPGQPRPLTLHREDGCLYAQGQGMQASSSMQAEVPAAKEEVSNLPGYPLATSPTTLLASVLNRTHTSSTPDILLHELHSRAPTATTRQSRFHDEYPRLQIPELPQPPDEGFAGKRFTTNSGVCGMDGAARSCLTQTSKARRDLSPIKQRASAFKAGINKNSVFLSPDYAPGSVMESVLEYCLPPPAPEDRLDASLLNDFRASAPSFSSPLKNANMQGVDAASLGLCGGSFTLPASPSRSLLSSSQKLPFHTASASLLATSLGGKSVAAYKSVAELLQLLAPQNSMAESYTFDVPASVHTGLDAVTLFASSAAKDGLIVFCNLNPAAQEYDPYDLAVVKREDINPSYFYIITQMGVTHMWNGVAFELVPHHEWIRNAEMFATLKKLVFFKKQRLFLAFRKWHTTIRSIRFTRRQQMLANSLLHLSPAYRHALLAIRRMTLSVCDDPSTAWRRIPLPGNCCTWVEAESPHGSSRMLHQATTPEAKLAAAKPAQHKQSQQQQQQRMVGPGSANELANSQGQLESEMGSKSSARGVSSARTSGSLPSSKPETREGDQDGILGQRDPKLTNETARQSRGGNTNNAVKGDRGAHTQTQEGVTEREEEGASTAVTGSAGSELASSSSTQPSCTIKALEASKAETSGFPPNLSLMGPGERLPERGLAAQLGHVGGVQDQYALPDFRQMRTEAKDAVQLPVAQMLHFVVQHVQEVGGHALASFQAATAALAPPTIQQAKAKRFEFIPGKDRWKHHSQHLAKEADATRVRTLAAAQQDCSKFGAFVALADALLLSQMVELARLSVAVVVHEVFLPRRLGLFLVSGQLQDRDPESCPRAAHFFVHSPTIAPSALSKQATQKSVKPWDARQDLASKTVTDGSNTEPHKGGGLLTQFTKKSFVPRSSMKDGNSTSAASAVAAAAAAPVDLEAAALSAAPILFVPALEEVMGALEEVIRDIVGVTAHTACGLRNNLDVRALLRSLRAKAEAASLHLDALGWRSPLSAYMHTLSSNSIGSGGRLKGWEEEKGTARYGSGQLRVGVGSPALDLLQREVKAEGLSTYMTSQIKEHYTVLLANPHLQPYIGHAEEWELVESMRACASTHDHTAAILDTPVKQLQRPHKLVAELNSTNAWVLAIARSKSVQTHGLLHFDLTGCRSELLQRVAAAHQGLMDRLGAYLLVMLKDMLARLQRYIDRLSKRPSALPDFVSWMESVWSHLDISGTKRQQITAVYEQVSVLHSKLMAALPQPDSTSEPPSPKSVPNEHWGLKPSSPTVTMKVARPVHLIWKQIEVLMNKYLDEAAGAAEFFVISSPMMTTLLKNSLLQMESDLLELLREMRTGKITSTSTPRAEVGAALSAMEQRLSNLDQQHTQYGVWAKLLLHGGFEQNMSQVQKLMAAATQVLTARTRMWHILGEWGELMDTMYATPCFGEFVGTRSLVERLEMDLEELAEEVEGITSLHASDDVSSTDTVTPEEANLGAHYSLIVCAWQDMLPFAQQLIHSSIKPRHFCILASWLRTCRAPMEASAVAMDDRYPVTLEHVSPSDTTAAEFSPSAELTAVRVCKPGTAAAEAAASIKKEAASAALAQLLSRCTETDETRALTNRVIEVAAAEQQLDAMMTSLQMELANTCVEFSQQRIFGVFIITNAKEVLDSISSLEGLLAGVRYSPHYGGVMPQYELTEQLLREAANVITCALRCQDWVLLLSQLFSCAEVVAACAHVASVWEPLGVEWRKITLAAHGAQFLTPCMLVLQGIDVLEKALEQVYALVCRQMLPAMRADYPRLHFVADRLLMEGLAAGNDVSCLPVGLLDALYQGLRGITCLPDSADTVQSMAALAASPKPHNAPHHHIPPSAWPPQEVVAVEACSGEAMPLTVGVSYSAALQPLAQFFANLELALRLSLKAHTKSCLDACGAMQAHIWVASFPAQAVLLVDAVVWTRSVSSVLARTAAGDRPALRAALDASVLRLETLARQLRTAMATAAALAKRASAMRQQGILSGWDGAAAVDELEEEEAALEAARQSVRGLRALIAAGVVHRQVVDGLVSCEAPSLDSFEWLRQVRHYWDNETDILYVAFAQTRMPYGFEYCGREVDAACATAPLSVPGLLATLNALQTSPVVSLCMSGPQGGGQGTVTSLASVVGKYAAAVEFGPDTTSACCARTLAAAVASDSWLAIDGAQKLSLQVLSCFSQQLYEVWAAFFYGSSSVMLSSGRGGNTGLIPSPWSKSSSLDAPAPCSLFVSLPMSSYLSSPHTFLMDSGAIGNSQLSQSLRQVSRAVMLAPPGIGLSLEIWLRSMGLRDAAEAARAVSCCFHLAAMQLPPRPQYSFGLLVTRSLVAFIREQWLSASFTPPPSTPTSLSHDSSGNLTQQAPPPRDLGNALDAVDAALHAVLLRLAHPDDASLLSRLVYQVTSSLPRTQSPTGTPAAPPPLPRTPSTFLVPYNDYQNNRSQGAGQGGACLGYDWCLPSLDSIKQQLERLVASAAGEEHRRIRGGSELLQGATLGHQGLTPEGHVQRMQAFAQDAHIKATKDKLRGGGSPSSKPTLLPLPPQGHKVGVPWTAMHPTRLLNAVLDLATQLRVSGAVLLVGSPGIGKSLAWRALVTAVSGEDALTQDATPCSRARAHPPLVHCYPATLALPVSVLGGQLPAAEASMHGRDCESAARSGLQAWLHTVLEGLESQQVCTRVREDVGEAQAVATVPAGAPLGPVPSSTALSPPSSMPRIQVAPVPGASAPEWVVLDGPLTTTAAEVLLPLIVGTRSKTAGGCGSGGLALRSSTKLVWECGSLAGASPALLASAPVLYLGQPLLDDRAATRRAVALALSRTCAAHYLLAPAAEALSRQPAALITNAIAGCTRLLSEAAMGRTQHSASPEHSPSSSVTLPAEGLVHIPGQHPLSKGAPPTAPPSSPECVMEEHSMVLAANATHTTLAILSQLLAGLELPPQLEDMSLLLGRATLFALHWSFAALPMHATVRAQMGHVLREAAAHVQAEAALPPNGANIGAFILGPKTGEWARWESAFEAITDQAQGIMRPPIQTSDSRVPAPQWHLFNDPLNGQPTLFVPSGPTLALEHVATLAMRAGLHPILLGESGSGKATLMRHLLATAPIQPQSRVDVVGLQLTPSTPPFQMSALVASRLSHGIKGCLRTTSGRLLVVAVEDLSAVIRTHPPPGNAPAPTYAPLGTSKPPPPSASWGRLPSAYSPHGSKDAAVNARACTSGSGMNEVDAQGSSEGEMGGAAGLCVAAVARMGGPEGTEPAVATPPCLEWLRQLLDTGSLAGAGTSGCSSQSTHGISIIATSTLLHLLAGQQQACPRLWRHLHHLHMDTASAAVTHASPAAAAAAAVAPIFCTYSTAAVHNAMAHHTLLELAQGRARVPELLAISQPGMLQAARVMGLALDKLLGCVQGLLQAQLLPRGWQFDTSQTGALVKRLRTAAAKAGPGKWNITDIVQRLMFEAGRQVIGLLDKEESTKDVLTRVLLHSMGRELGALLKGRFNNMLQIHEKEEQAKVDRILRASMKATAGAQAPSPKPQTPLLNPRQMLAGVKKAPLPAQKHDDDTGLSAASAASPPHEVRELAALWQSYADNAEGPAMTRLCVSLAGKISPSDINLLIAVGRANLHYLMHNGPRSKSAQPPLRASMLNRATRPSQGGPPGHQMSMELQPQDKDADAPDQAAPDQADGTAVQGPQGWRWLHRLPVGLNQNDLLAQLATTATITGVSQAATGEVVADAWTDMKAPGAARQSVGVVECSLAGSPTSASVLTSQRAPFGSESLQAQLGEEGDSLASSASSDSSDSDSSEHEAGAASEGNNPQLDGTTRKRSARSAKPKSCSSLWEDPSLDRATRAAVLRAQDVLSHSEYEVCLAGVSHFLVEGFSEGGNVLLSGHSTHLLADVGRLAAAAVGASVLQLQLPSPGSIEDTLLLTQHCATRTGHAAAAVHMQASACVSQPAAPRQQLLSLLVRVLGDDLRHAQGSGELHDREGAEGGVVPAEASLGAKGTDEGHTQLQQESAGAQLGGQSGVSGKAKTSMRITRLSDEEEHESGVRDPSDDFEHASIFDCVAAEQQRSKAEHSASENSPNSTSRWPKSHCHPAQRTRSSRPVQRAKRYVLVVDEEVAADDELIELLQQLVCFPASVTGLATAECAQGLARALDEKVESLVEAGVMQAWAGQGVLDVQGSQPLPPHAGLLDGLHGLMDLRYNQEVDAYKLHTSWLREGFGNPPKFSHQLEQEPQASSPGSPATSKSAAPAEVTFPDTAPRTRPTSSATNRQAYQPSSKRASPIKRGMSSRPHSSMGSTSRGKPTLVDEGLQAAEAKVDSLRKQQAALVSATAEATRRFTHRVRIILAVSPARTAALQAQFPALCQALSLVQGPPLLCTGSALHSSVQQKLHALILLEPPTSPRNTSTPAATAKKKKPAAQVARPNSTMHTGTAAQRVNCGLRAEGAKGGHGAHPQDGLVLSAVGQKLLGNDVPAAPASWLQTAKEETAASDPAARFAQQVLDTHAVAAQQADDVAAGLSPNSRAVEARHAAQTAVAAASGAAKPAAAAAVPTQSDAAASFSRGAHEEASEGEPSASGDYFSSKAGSENFRNKTTVQGQIKALAMVLAAIHAQAQELMWQIGLLQRGTPLPQSKVSDLLHVLTHLHSTHRKLLCSEQAGLWVALEKLGHEEESRVHSGCTATVAKLQDAIAVSRKAAAESQSKLEVLAKFRSSIAAELQPQELLLEENATIVRKVAQDIDLSIELARKRYLDATQDAGTLTEGDLAEIRSYQVPHGRVRLIMMAVCVLFQAPMDWRSAQRLLGEQNPKFLERLATFDVTSLDVVSLAQLTQLTAEPEFNIVQAAQVSAALKPLCWWVLSVAELVRTLKQTEIKRDKIANAEARVAAAEKYVRQLRGELQAAQHEEQRQIKAKKDAEQDVTEMQALIRDTDSSSQNLHRLKVTLNLLQVSWRAKLREIEAQLPDLLGDAMLASAAVTYCGALLPTQRLAALEAWHKLLQGAGVPTSERFELHRFLSPRQGHVLRNLSPDVQVSAPASWLENLVLMGASVKPTLLIDPEGVAAPLLKAQHGGQASHGLVFDINNSNLPDKVSAAVGDGFIVVVDIHFGNIREAGLLQQVVAHYKVALKRIYPREQLMPHLFVRMMSSPAALPPILHHMFNPVRFGFEHPELDLRLTETLLGAIDPDALAELRQVTVKAWEVSEEIKELQHSIMFGLSHSSGLLRSNASLVDATISRVRHMTDKEQLLPQLQARAQELDDATKETQQEVLSAAHLAYECMTFLSAHDPRVAMPVAQYLAIFRAAVLLVRQQVNLAPSMERRTPLISKGNKAGPAAAGVAAAQARRARTTRRASREGTGGHGSSHSSHHSTQQQPWHVQAGTGGRRVSIAGGSDGVAHQGEGEAGSDALSRVSSVQGLVVQAAGHVENSEHSCSAQEATGRGSHASGDGYPAVDGGTLAGARPHSPHHALPPGDEHHPARRTSSFTHGLQPGAEGQEAAEGGGRRRLKSWLSKSQAPGAKDVDNAEDQTTEMSKLAASRKFKLEPLQCASSLTEEAVRLHHAGQDELPQGLPAQQAPIHQLSNDGSLYGTMLFHLSQLLSACLAAPHARLLRSLLSLHTLARVGAITTEELLFAVEVLQLGPPPVQTLLEHYKQRTSLAQEQQVQQKLYEQQQQQEKAGKGTSRLQHGSMAAEFATMHGPPLRATMPPEAGPSTLSMHAAASNRPAPDSKQTEWPGDVGKALLCWLEHAYPRRNATSPPHIGTHSPHTLSSKLMHTHLNPFAGISEAVAEEPEPWLAALRHPDLGRPAAAAAAHAAKQHTATQAAAAMLQAVVARTEASLEPEEQQELGPHATTDLTAPSLTSMASAANLALAAMTGGGFESINPEPLMLPERHSNSGNKLQALSSHSSIPPPASTFQLPMPQNISQSGMQPPSLGVACTNNAVPASSVPLRTPQDWAEHRLTSPLHWFLLAWLLEPAHQAGPAADWLARLVLGSNSSQAMIAAKGLGDSLSSCAGEGADVQAAEGAATEQQGRREKRLSRQESELSAVAGLVQEPAQQPRRSPGMCQPGGLGGERQQLKPMEGWVQESRASSTSLGSSRRNAQLAGRKAVTSKGPALGEATPGEQVLVGVLTQPTNLPLLLACSQDEDAVAAVHAAAAALAHGCPGVAPEPQHSKTSKASANSKISMSEQPPQAHGDAGTNGPERVVVARWNAGAEEDVGVALVQAMRLGHWLVLLDVHTASRAQLLEVVAAVNACELPVSGPGESAVGFRLMLAMPYAAIGCVPPVVRQRSMAIVLEKPASLAACVRASLQLLAHPLASYIGFYSKPADREYSMAAFGVLLSLSTLGHTLGGCGPPSAALPPSYSMWDMMAALHLVKLMMAEARKQQEVSAALQNRQRKLSGRHATLQGGASAGIPSQAMEGSDYRHIRELLLADVVLPRCPSGRMANHASALVARLVNPHVLSSEYPVHHVPLPEAMDGVDTSEAGDLEAAAKQGSVPLNTSAWPFQALGLRETQDFVAQVLEPEAELWPQPFRASPAQLEAAATSAQPLLRNITQPVQRTSGEVADTHAATGVNATSHTAGMVARRSSAGMDSSRASTPRALPQAPSPQPSLNHLVTQLQPPHGRHSGGTATPPIQQQGDSNTTSCGAGFGRTHSGRLLAPSGVTKQVDSGMNRAKASPIWSLQGHAPWPLSPLLCYQSSAQGAYAQHASLELRLLLASCTHPFPITHPLHANSDARAPVPLRSFQQRFSSLKSRHSRSTLPHSLNASPLPAASPSFTSILGPNSPAAAPSHLHQHSQTQIHYGTKPHIHALPSAPAAVAAASSTSSLLLSAPRAHRPAAHSPVLQGTEDAPHHPQLCTWLGHLRHIVSSANAALATRVEGAQSRGRLLSCSLEALALEAMTQEARLLNAALQAASRTLMHLAAAAKQHLLPPSPPLACAALQQAGRALERGFVPTSWHAALAMQAAACTPHEAQGATGAALVTLHAWQARVERGAAAMSAAAMNTLFAEPSLHSMLQQQSMDLVMGLHDLVDDLHPQGLPPPRHTSGVPQLAVQALSVPTALMAILMRAHAHEHSVHVGNVACRLLPLGSTAAAAALFQSSPSSQYPRPPSQPHSSAARRGIVLHGLGLRDGVLAPHMVPDAISNVMGEAWALDEMPQGCELSTCGPLLLLPTFADPHAGMCYPAGRGVSAGRRLPSAHAGLSTSRATTATPAATTVLGGTGVNADLSIAHAGGVGGSGSSQALCVPVSLSRLGGVVGEAGGVVLHVDVRVPLGNSVPAPPAARGLCFAMVMDEEWAADGDAVIAIARESSWCL